MNTHILSEFDEIYYDLDKVSIDDAIINDLTNNVNLSTIPTPPFRNGQKTKDISILIQGHKITYRVVKLPNGELSVNTYFPTP